MLTRQIVTCDPETGKQTYPPMYRHAWTDGPGNCFLRGHDDGSLPFPNAKDRHKLKIINHKESGDRPPQWLRRGAGRLTSRVETA